MKYIIADPHFDHENIRIHCNRPFQTLDEMNSTMVTNWNNVVGKKDEIYIVGDFAWKNHMHWFHQLNGMKHLVIGNHDKMNQKTMRNFTSTALRMEVIHNGRPFVLDHFPLRTWNRRMYDAIHCFGHVHGRLNNDLLPNTLDVGVDSHNFTPITFDRVIELIKPYDDPDGVKIWLVEMEVDGNLIKTTFRGRDEEEAWYRAMEVQPRAIQKSITRYLKDSY